MSQEPDEEDGPPEPLVPRSRPGAGQVGGEPAASGGAAIRILLAEDDSWDAELAQRLLSRAGLRCAWTVVASREAFTEQLAAGRPDVVVSDFSMPGFTGEEALRIAKERYPDLPVVIWSGVLGDETAVGLIKEGATDYILKDRPARLGSAVERAVAEARQRRRLAEIELQLGQAQRLASLGKLVAAEQAVTRTRQMLEAIRGELAADQPSEEARLGRGTTGGHQVR